MNQTVTLLALFSSPIIVYMVNRYYLSRKLKLVTLSAISALLLYVTILVSVGYIELKLDAELAAFDLNGDGFFSGVEITPEQEKAMYRVISDTGRTFAPITGGVLSLLYFFVLWTCWSVISWGKKRYVTKNT